MRAERCAPTVRTGPGSKWFRVRQQLRRESGAQFAPQVVTALIDALRAGDVPHEGRHEEMALEPA